MDHWPAYGPANLFILAIHVLLKAAAAAESINRTGLPS